MGSEGRGRWEAEGLSSGNGAVPACLGVRLMSARPWGGEGWGGHCWDPRVIHPALLPSGILTSFQHLLGSQSCHPS